MAAWVLHYAETKNLILENFYFWDSKAYSEDLYHSFYLKEKGVQMTFDKNSKLYVGFLKKSRRFCFCYEGTVEIVQCDNRLYKIKKQEYDPIFLIQTAECCFFI